MTHPLLFVAFSIPSLYLTVLPTTLVNALSNPKLADTVTLPLQPRISITPSSKMPITIMTTDHPANHFPWDKVSNSEELLEESCPNNHRRSNGIIQSSFPEHLFEGSHILPSTNGFVYAIYRAYSRHHHLVIRPEDVWFSILTQLSFYINKHAEELRHLFVAHEGQKELEVRDYGSLYTADYQFLAQCMADKIDENVVDPELKEWIMPSFSTTTYVDRTVAAVLMMGTMQKYFSYKVTLMCGIPTVTLLGERDDWVQLLKKLDKIAQFGDEASDFEALLRTVLKRFVACFDDPSSAEVKDFWGKCITRIYGGSGPAGISGWITAFCFWDEDGECLAYRDKRPTKLFPDDFVSGRFHEIEEDKIPVGFASVPVTVDDNGVEYKTTMLAGSVGIKATSTNPAVHIDGQNGDGSNKPVLDSILPVSGWWMYKREDVEGTKAREREEKELEDETEEEL